MFAQILLELLGGSTPACRVRDGGQVDREDQLGTARPGGRSSCDELGSVL